MWCLAVFELRVDVTVKSIVKTDNGWWLCAAPGVSGDCLLTDHRYLLCVQLMYVGSEGVMGTRELHEIATHTCRYMLEPLRLACLEGRCLT